MKTIEMPNGDQVDFPDDMPKEQIRALIAKKFPQDVASHFEEKAQAIRSGMSWSDVASGVKENIVPSAVQFASDVAQPILHPIETAENIGSVGMGVMQKMGIMSGEAYKQYADAVGEYFTKRYGGWENIKQSIAKDPVGVAADLSTVLSGGGAAAARAGGTIGRVGEVAGTVGRAVDPLTAAGKGLTTVGKVGSEVLGITTGAGGEAIRGAARAGAAGGEESRAFLENLSGRVPPEQVVTDAKRAVTQLRIERGNAYREAMAKLGTDSEVLDFNKVDDAINKVAKVKVYKGVPISTKTQAIREELLQSVEEWKALPPADFHTAEGLDALKQKIGEIRGATQYGTPDRVVADNVYNAVKNTIVEQAPEYAKIMKGYEEATSIITEMEKTLSLNPKATIDTQLRKLQSVLRSNVSTNFGRRAELVDFLQRSGAPHLMAKLAGQALGSVAPRGLGRLSALGDISGAAAALAAHEPTIAAGLGVTLGASSPLLMGGAAYGAGAASRFARPAARGLYQIGRLPPQ